MGKQKEKLCRMRYEERNDNCCFYFNMNNFQLFCDLIFLLQQFPFGRRVQSSLESNMSHSNLENEVFLCKEKYPVFCISQGNIWERAELLGTNEFSNTSLLHFVSKMHEDTSKSSWKIKMNKEHYLMGPDV